MPAPRARKAAPIRLRYWKAGRIGPFASLADEVNQVGRLGAGTKRLALLPAIAVAAAVGTGSSALGPTKVAACLGTSLQADVKIVCGSGGGGAGGSPGTKCDPSVADSGRVNDNNTYFDGWGRNFSYVIGGVYASIYNYSPWVWPQKLNNGNFNASSAWTMLAASTIAYGQIGWWEFAFGERHTFIQFADSSGPDTVYEDPSGSQPVGTSSYYTTLYGADGAGVLSFQVNGSTIFDRLVSFSPTSAQIAGEINTLSDQMPGNTSFHEDLADSHVYTQGWQTFSGGPFSGDNFDNWAKVFPNKVVNATDIQIWDADCP